MGAYEIHQKRQGADETHQKKLRVLAKCCTKEVNRQWKRMKLECHEKFYKRIVVNYITISFN
jgi:hypothetical protein